MNKKRNYKKSSSKFAKVELAFYVLAALAVIAGGVNLAIIKNEQVAMDREMDKVRQQIKVYNSETRTVQVQIKRKVNRFAVKSELREQGSIMRERPDYVVERVLPVDRPLVSIENIKEDYPNLVVSHATSSY